MTPRLTALLRTGFKLDWKGVHGVGHWARVRHNGLLLAQQTGANARLVELFAFLHDSQRLSDGDDPLHGMRAAEFARSLNGDYFELTGEELSLLEVACSDHSDGHLEADVTVQTCWDADRLDLGRVGIKPDPRFLCTAPAKDPAFLEAAYRRGVAAW